MRIPTSVKGRRFYVATSATKAFSSWGTWGEAFGSYERLPREEREKVIGIVEVNGSTHTRSEV